MLSMRTTLLAGAMLLATALPVHAVDGVVLVDQNRALVGNVTTGDTPGFPISINLPGSYRLSGNLTVPTGVNGIEISSDDVSLDLNGFRLVTGGGGAEAIRDTGAHQRVSISNGTLDGFGTGILMMSSQHCSVRDVRTTNLSSVSLVVGPFSMLQRNQAQGLIQAECPSILSENVTEGFITVVVGSSGELCVRWNNRSLNFTGAVTQ